MAAHSDALMSDREPALPTWADSLATTESGRCALAVPKGWSYRAAQGEMLLITGPRPADDTAFRPNLVAVTERTGELTREWVNFRQMFLDNSAVNLTDYLLIDQEDTSTPEYPGMRLLATHRAGARVVAMDQWVTFAGHAALTVTASSGVESYLRHLPVFEAIVASLQWQPRTTEGEA